MMSAERRPSDFFVAGGTLRPDAPSYVKRPADDELFDRALRGEFCYVLTPRQMGKSSLMARTARRLRERGVRTAIVDLTSIGANVTPDQWYLSLLTQLQRRLRLAVHPVAWWRERAGLTHVRRLIDFLHDMVLTEIEGRVVVFIDEIDSTLSLDFRDDFFAAIRAVYNARAGDPAFERLTFVLLGVAAPTDLISDQARTPFNIGQGIGLGEFSRADAAVLQAGLKAACPGQGAAVFDRIYHWTGGHPYLTQKLCLAVVERDEHRWTDERVDALVEDLFLTEEARSEANLKFVQSNVLDHPRRTELLKLYGQVLKQGARGIKDDGQSPLHNRLKLSGIVRAEDGRLRVRNQVYRRVFDRAWVREHTAVNWARVVAGGAILVALLALGALLYNTWVDIRVSRCVDDFYQAAAPGERVTDLARIFRARGLFGPGDYDYRARELFYGLTTAEQVALFDARDVAGADLVAVVSGLYVMGGDTALLEGMRDALDRLAGATGERMQGEIGSWLQARVWAGQGRYAEARAAYDDAIGLNGDNPATRYERAVVLVALTEYPLALDDLDQAVAVARRVAAPTPTPLPETSAPTERASYTPSDLTPHSTVVDITPVDPTAILTVERTVPAGGTETPGPTATPVPTSTVVPGEPVAVASGFGSWGAMIGAVRDLIHTTPGLVEALVGASSEAYPNLQEAGLASIVQTRSADGMTMVYVPGGTFPMGSDDDDMDYALQLCNEYRDDCQRSWFESEQPVHEVTLDGFWLDQTEVTVTQFRQFVAETGYETDAEREGWSWAWTGTEWAQVDGADWYHPHGPDEDVQNSHPVVHVSWNDAMSYCEWAGARLPTEAEWEYTARGSEGRIYPWGNTFDCSLGNFDDEMVLDDYVVSGGEGCDEYVWTAPVGSFSEGASWCDALDVAGNVSEWVADWYGDYPTESQTNPTGTTDGDNKVLRGGSFHFSQNHLRAASRNDSPPSYRYDSLGFRCVTTAPGQ
jgi:formylglycine-generating enzyme required for sulfatase activity